jgi:hypothetical protein
MKKVNKLTEKDLNRIVKRVISESTENVDEKYTKYSKPYTHFKSIDDRLAEMINELHGAYGMGVDSSDEYMKKCSDEGHKVMNLLRKAKEVSNKALKEKFEVLKSMSNELRK